ncbi:V-type ATP synthase subunit E [Breznakiellaceae bacterium SP9]
MEIQLQELIQKIKKEGIESASEEAGRLKAQAEQEAKRIVEAGRKEAEGIIAKAKADAEHSEQVGIAALEQASRNLVLVFKGEIQSLLDKIVANELSSNYNADVLKAVLPELLKAWSSKGTENSLDLIVDETNLKSLQTFFDEKLSTELKKGVELKSDRNIGAGFRIANKDGSSYYDFSGEAVAEMLSAYLNPRLAEILKKSAKGS